MLLRQLLSAIASRAERQEQPPAETTVSSHTGPVIREVGLAKDKSLTAVYGGPDEQALDAFLALPPAEQRAAIEAELEQLSEREQKDLIRLLGKELARKWIPQPKQIKALNSEADILLYGGSAGGGKSDLLLGLALTEHKRSLIMRRQYTDLSFLTERAVEINRTRTGFNASPPPTLRTDDGRVIEFGAAQHAGDEQRWQGRPHDLLGLDEAAQFLESQIRYLMGWVRSTEEGQRTRIVLATNPPLSDEGQYLVRMFAPWLDPQHGNPAKPGELRWFVTDEEGQDQEVEGRGPHIVSGKPVIALSRTFIPAALSDNAYLARTEYAAKLDALPEPLRSAVRDGNFMAVRADDAFQVIPSEWIRLAQARWTAQKPERQAMACIALDPAGGGKDAAAFASRYGPWFSPVTTIKGPETSDGVLMGARMLMLRDSNCQTVIDVGGGYGTEALNSLKRNEQAVIGFKGSDASAGKSVGSNLEFGNKRAEVWWRFREALDPVHGDNLALPPDQELAADLATPRLDARAMQVRGVIQVESKEDIRKRLGRSPDKGDAVVMCRAYGGLREYERAKTPRLPPRANVGHASAKRYAAR
jgi:hypothetical protein